MKTLSSALLLAFLLSVAPASRAADDISLIPLVSGLDSPDSITNAGDARLFITSQSGLVYVYDPGSGTVSTFLDLTRLVSCCSERGLLGLAFHPQYRENGYFYVDYTNTDGDTVIARYSVRASNPQEADPSSGVKLLTIEQPYPNHNGGQLQFGPDGYLYIGMGDGGSGGDPEDRAQDLSQLLGKILRIDVDHGSPYAIPSSNPFVTRGGARGEIWAYGLRNPWRFSFDRANGDLWIGDVGQEAWEEVDLQRASSSGGENYGWPLLEATHCYKAHGCSATGTVLPVAEFSHTAGCSVIGGYVYRGTRMPALQGTYFYSDFCSGTIWNLTHTTEGAWQSRVLKETNLAITSFGEDMNGELYVASYDDGTLYAISGPVPSFRRRIAR